MRRYSKAAKAYIRRRMSPPHRQSVAQVSEELGIHVITLYNWRSLRAGAALTSGAGEGQPQSN
jgi:transposase-like protein